MPTTDQQDQFISNAIDQSGGLTPAQAAQLLEMGGIPGDTGTQPDTSSVPGAANDGAKAGTDDATKTNSEADGKAAGTAPNEDQLNADNAVILAKDGKHTIGYDKLVAAREGEKAARTEAEQLRAQVEAANRQLAELQASANARTEAGQAPTKTDNQVAAAQAAIDAGVDPGLFGDFSEEALAKGIAQLVQQQVQARVDERMAQVDAKLKPIEQKAVSDSTQAHYSAIYDKHPDADSLVESQEFEAWIKSQPSIAQQAYAQVLDKGTAPQIIEVFDAFKKATGGTGGGTDTKPEGDVKGAAKAAIAGAAVAPPASLSDIPGGRTNGASVEETMASMSAQEQLDAMVSAGWSAEKIERYLNSQI